MDVKEILQQESVVSEAMLTGLFWNNPYLYEIYSKDKLDYDTFQNKYCAFFFSLGRKMIESGLKSFDSIAVAKTVKDYACEDQYEMYGGLETIEELKEESKENIENIENYYTDIKKYNMLKNLTDLFGDKVLKQTGKYDYKKMTKEQIHTYWNDKVNKLAMDGDNKYKEAKILKGLRERVKDWKENPAVGLPFYNAKKWTKICTGWDYGNMYIFGGFGGSGKTSVSFEKVVMSCIEQKEKLLIIANEQGEDDFCKMLVTTAMGTGTKAPIQRQKFNEGNFTAEDDKKIDNAIDWIEEVSGNDDSLVALVFMDNYVMEDVKTLIRHYHARGYRRVIIDTGKPSEDAGNKARWEIMADDFRDLYKICRPSSLNIALWINVQLSDSAISRRFLNESALGESKKLKNEASVLFLMRHVWDDEYAGGKHEITVTNYVSDELQGGYKEVEFKLDRAKGDTYMLVFTAKNRRGQDNKTGQRVLVLKADFNSNTYNEVGWTTIYDDKNY